MDSGHTVPGNPHSVLDSKSGFRRDQTHGRVRICTCARWKGKVPTWVCAGGTCEARLTAQCSQREENALILPGSIGYVSHLWDSHSGCSFPLPGAKRPTAECRPFLWGFPLSTGPAATFLPRPPDSPVAVIFLCFPVGSRISPGFPPGFPPDSEFCRPARLLGSASAFVAHFHSFISFLPIVAI